MGWSAFRKTGLTHYEPASAVKGYTLITPDGGDSSYLLNMQGEVVHQWRFSGFRPGYGRLLDNGHLLLRAVDPELVATAVANSPKADHSKLTLAQHVRQLGANATDLLEVDWSGNIVWQYRNPAIHHDFVRLPDGNTLIPEWIELPQELARRVRGGIRGGEKLPPMLSDDIIEIDPKGKEVRRIHLWQLLDPVRDPICPLEPRREWTHVNGLSVTRSRDIVFSCREMSRVGIIDQSGAKLLWKFGAPVTSHQHHPTVLANGNIQIFDNGMHAPGWSRSRIIEVDPRNNSIVWQYTADPPYQFFSSHISSAERLPGGNVLICEGSAGRLFEVTPRGETVWEWINPFVSRVDGFLRPRIFRAHRYTADHPAIAGQNLAPGRYSDFNRLHGLAD